MAENLARMKIDKVQLVKKYVLVLNIRVWFSSFSCLPVQQLKSISSTKIEDVQYFVCVV